jgi:hypothetical protein
MIPFPEKVRTRETNVRVLVNERNGGHNRYLVYLGGEERGTANVKTSLVSGTQEFFFFFFFILRQAART